MKSLLPLFLCFVGFFILILIYYIFIYQKSETPLDVLIRLIRHNQQTILAFTYQKVGDSYQNYYVTEDLDLESKVEDFPVTFDGLPVRDNSHGVVFDITGGFGVSGIEFVFTCPSGWNYENGKCVLGKICQPSDVDVYKGISYYQFNEAFNSFRMGSDFHPRLYVDCNTGLVKNCQLNELYMGGESIPNNIIPCEPYDMCQDMLTMTTHNFPIFNGDILGPNEFYICQNGVSVRRTCPQNTQFSRTQNACMPVSRCFNVQDGTTINVGELDQFILCRNGEENIIRCRNGIFLGDPQIECVNNICLNPRTIYQNFGNGITIPIGKMFCMPGTNIPQEFRCSGSKELHKDDVSGLINENFPTIEPPVDRFAEFEVPGVQYDSETDTCVEFVFDRNYIVRGTHNKILPPVPINVQTLKIDYSEVSQENDMYYKNYNLIMKHPSNEIVVTSNKYSNFVTIPTLDTVQYVNTVRLVTGSNDGVNYLISGPVKSPRLSTISVAQSPTGETSAGLVWNAYTTTFTLFAEAHSTFYSVREFSPEIYMFTYTIVLLTPENYIMHVLTPFGFCTFGIDLHEGVTIDQNGWLAIPNLPSYESMHVELLGPNNTMVVTDIYDGRYNFIHRPYFLNYITVNFIISPQNNIASNMKIEDFFKVDSGSLFEFGEAWN